MSGVTSIEAMKPLPDDRDALRVLVQSLLAEREQQQHQANEQQRALVEQQHRIEEQQLKTV